MPVSVGRALNSAENASSPPADAPIPTIGKLGVVAVFIRRVRCVLRACCFALLFFNFLVMEALKIGFKLLIVLITGSGIFYTATSNYVIKSRSIQRLNQCIYIRCHL